MVQEWVMRSTTKGSSVEFIGYRMLQNEQNGCTVLFTRHQSINKSARAFLIGSLDIVVPRYNEVSRYQKKMFVIAGSSL